MRPRLLPPSGISRLTDPRLRLTDRRLLLAASALAALLVGCSSGSASPRASGGPASSSTPAPNATHPAGFIEHPTGATQLVLRYDEGGGFVAPGSMVTEGPPFSLYGDGTVIFRDPTAMPPTNVGTLSFNAPYQIAKLTEDQVQTLLQFAIGPGGLAAARASYEQPIADAPTTTFTLSAGSITKTTSVNGLGLETQPGPDAVILHQLATLKARLQGFGNEVVGERPWSPDRFRGILMDAQDRVVTGELPWPWATINPADFVAPADANQPRFARRTLLPADVAALKLAGIDGGVRGILLLRPDGKRYELAIRPLLRDERD